MALLSLDETTDGLFGRIEKGNSSVTTHFILACCFD